MTSTRLTMVAGAAVLLSIAGIAVRSRHASPPHNPAAVDDGDHDDGPAVEAESARRARGRRTTASAPDEPAPGEPTRVAEMAPGSTGAAPGLAPGIALGQVTRPDVPPFIYRGTETAPSPILSGSPPAASHTADDLSPSLQSILDAVHPTREQENKIRELWEAHEDSRRFVLEHPSPSPGRDQWQKTEFHRLDTQFEIALGQGGVLDANQMSALHGALYPRGE